MDTSAPARTLINTPPPLSAANLVGQRLIGVEKVVRPARPVQAPRVDGQRCLQKENAFLLAGRGTPGKNRKKRWGRGVIKKVETEAKKRQ